MKDEDDIDFGADVSPSVFGKPLGFLEPKSAALRAAERAKRRGEPLSPHERPGHTSQTPEEIKRAEATFRAHTALHNGAGEQDWEPPVTMH
jgi:hypothetical protein